MSGDNSPIRLPLIEGKDIRFTHFSTEQGLSQSRVDHILQDNQGFLWFGTYNGLNRYDGYRFLSYKPQAGNPSSIGGVFLYALFQDRSGVLWIAVDQGLDRFDPVTGRFEHFRSNPADPASLAGHVEHIAEDRDGMLWLATRNGLDRLDPASGRFTHFRNDPNDPQSLSSNDVRFVLEDRQGTLWVATAAGPEAFNPRTGKVIRHYHSPNSPQTPLDRIFEDRSGTLWLSATRGGGLTSLDPKTGVFTTYIFYDEWPEAPGTRGCSAILEDQRGMLWLATRPDGVVRFDRQRRQFTRYRNDPSNPTSLNNNDALSLIEDREGGIWVGTDGGGVNRFPSAPSPFTIYRKEPGNPNSLDQSYALSIFEDSEGILWVGTKQLNRLDRKTGHYTFYRHDPANSGSIAANGVNATVEDRAGFLWFGTWGGGLNRFDRRTGRFKAYRHDPANPASLSQDYIRSLLLDHEGNVWAGAEDGLNRLDVRTGRFTVYRFNGPLDSRIYRVLAEDLDGSIWMGTYEQGLQRLDVHSGKIAAYKQDPKVRGSLSNNRVNALYVDRSGTLWVGTQNGLDRFDSHTGGFTVFNERDGLPNNAIEGILEDAAGNLWLATGNGLSKFDPQARTFKNYYAEDGLAGNEFSDSSVYFKSGDGEMFFGGVNGITAFYPDRVLDNPYVPPIVLTDFRLFNNPVRVGEKSVLRKSISYTDALTLSHEQNIFSLEFSSLSFANPQRNRYRYKLEGLEKTWNEVGSDQRFVTYTTLPPGRYTFRVQGSSGCGVWNDRGVGLALTILPPWWRRLWFLVTASAILLALIWTAYYLRVRSIQRRNRELTVFNSELTAVNLELERSRRDLQESQGKLAEAQQIAHVGHWSYEIGADRFEWSEETYRILGLPPRARVLDFARALALTHPEDRQRIDKLFQGTLTGSQPYDVEHRIVRPNGEIRYVQLRGNPITDSDNRILRVFGTIQDITERKQAEERIRYLASIVESTDDAVIGKTLEGKIVSWNRGAEQIYGYTAEEAVGQPLSLLVPPGCQAEFDGVMARLRSGETIEHLETRRIRKGGQVIDVSLTICPIGNTSNQIIGASTIARDITERKRAEDTLRRLNRELRAVSDCNQVLVRATDEQQLLDEICHIVYEKAGYRMAWVGYAENDEAWTVRPVAWAGIEEGYLEAAHIVWADTEYGRGPTGTSIRTGKTAFVQDFAADSSFAPWREKALQRGYRSCVALPLKNESGAAFGAFTIYSHEPNAFTTDEIRLLEELSGDMAFGITVLRGRLERDRAEEEIRQLNAELEERVRQRTAQLEAANKELESFSYSVSHDLRAPLRHVSGFSKILMGEHREQLPEEVQKLLERIENGAQRMGRLIDGLLSFSRLGRQDMLFRTVALEELVKDVVEEMAPEWTSRQVEWKIGPLPTTQGDPILLRQVFQNLIDNALKFSRDRSPAIVEIGEIPQGGAHLLFVRDNGVGFDMKYADKLFGVFQRLHRADEFEGTGIGLATVQRIVQRHGGKIWAEAKVGEGATFFFTCR